jgi:hypothetical protein
MRNIYRSLFFFLLLLILPLAIYAQPKVLVLHANPTDRALDVQAKLVASGQFSVVDIFDMDNATGLGTVPTLSQLQAYDAIITFTNYGPLTGVGDIVAQYIEGGGGVVNGVFSIINDYRGLYTSATYQALVPGNAISGTELYLGTIALPLHPIMSGVSSFDGGSGSFHSDATTYQPGAYLVASWSDGSPLVVAKENVGAKKARIVDLNFFLPSDDVPTKVNYWHANTDGAKMMVNALLWVVPAPPAELSVTPKTVNFGSLATGGSSTQCVTLKDVGPNVAGATPLSFSSISISGNADYSIVSGGTQANMTPGQTSTVCVRFSPIANGARSATLTIVSNGRDSGTQTVALTGSGIAPGITVPTTSLFLKTRTRLGGSLTQSFGVMSSGAGPLTINSVTTIGQYANQYVVTRVPSAPIPAGTWDTISVMYMPTIEGSRPAKLVISSNATNNPSDTIGLFGTGTLARLVVTPSPLNFDSVGIGQQSCKDVTLYNSGSDTVFITHNFFTGRDADFTMTGLIGDDTIIAPDKFKIITICFNPIRSGSRFARLGITTTIPKTFDVPSRDTSSFYVNILGQGVPYGTLAVGGTGIIDSSIVGVTLCKTDTFYNTGAADVTITSATITGTNGSEFALSGVTLPLTVRPGQFEVFTLCGTPALRGDRNAFLSLMTTTSGKTLTLNLSLDIYGQLVCASATPTTAFSSKTCVGTTDTTWVTLTNCGDIRTAYTAALPANATGYAIVGSPTSLVVAGAGQAKFPITFTPMDRTPSNVTLTITGANGIVETVTLNGTGQAATAAGTGVADSTHVSASSNFNVIVKNTGECDWNPSMPTFSDPQFTYVSGGVNIPAGASGTLVVKFTPTSAGMKTATLSFPSAIGVSIPAANVTVSGFAISGAGVARVTEANGYSLSQNYPNPFNPTTEIRFVLAKSGNVKMDIIDITGKILRTVLNEQMSAGQHTTVVNASDLSSGVYYYQLSAGNTVLTRQMVLSK